MRSSSRLFFVLRAGYNLVMSNKPAIRVLIADQNLIVRESLSKLISTDKRIEVVQQDAEVILFLMSNQGGQLAAIPDIKKENPSSRVLILTSHTEDEQVWPAIKSGADGYLLKDAHPAELMQAIHGLHRGEITLHPTITHKLITELSQAKHSTPNPLTNREKEVLKLVAQGYSNGEIGRKLRLSRRTAGTYVCSILGKLHLSNRTQAALYALRQGLASLHPDYT